LRYYLFEVRFYSIEALYYAFFVGELSFLENWRARRSQQNSTKQIYKSALSIIESRFFCDCVRRAQLFHEGHASKEKFGSCSEPSKFVARRWPMWRRALLRRTRRTRHFIEICQAVNVIADEPGKAPIKQFEAGGYGYFPLCIVKTQLVILIGDAYCLNQITVFRSRLRTRTYLSGNFMCRHQRGYTFKRQMEINGMSTSQTALPAENPADSLRDAFSQSHNAVQWLARMERSFRSGNSGADVALQWNEERKAFVTDEFFDGLRMELKLPELTLQFLEDGKPVKHALHMEGRSPAQVEAWVLVELLHRGVDRDRFSKDLPYEIPHAMVGDGVEYSPEFREVELKRVLEWFSAAAELMKKLAKQPDNKGDSPSELVLRSRDFSLEVSVPLLGQTNATDNDRSIRVGFFPLRRGVVDPHYLVARSEPSKAAPDVFEIIKISGMTPTEIAGPEIAKKVTEIVARMQKVAAL
jgi:hypothetical protein